MSDRISKLVDAFLSWPLPPSVCADAVACRAGAPHRVGTNLLTAAEARAMFEHVISAALAGDVERSEDTAFVDWLADPANTIGNVQLPTDIVLANPHSLRDALREAMKRSEPS